MSEGRRAFSVCPTLHPSAEQPIGGSGAAGEFLTQRLPAVQEAPVSAPSFTATIGTPLARAHRPPGPPTASWNPSVMSDERVHGPQRARSRPSTRWWFDVVVGNEAVSVCAEPLLTSCANALFPRGGSGTRGGPPLAPESSSPPSGLPARPGAWRPRPSPGPKLTRQIPDGTWPSALRPSSTRAHRPRDRWEFGMGDCGTVSSTAWLRRAVQILPSRAR